MASVNSSAVNYTVTVAISGVIPVGIVLTQFSKLSDPLTFGETEIAGMNINTNGVSQKFKKKEPIPFSFTLMGGGSDDINFRTALNSQTIGQNKPTQFDDVKVYINYGNELILTLLDGVMTTDPNGYSITSEGMIQDSTFNFLFAKKV